MKKIFRKSNIFSFLLGAVIFSGITGVTAYTILASDVGFTPKNNSWKVDNLSDAIDDLYAKAKPTYTGTTTFTPTTSNQVIATGNKILTSDITINAIPSTYKNLTTTTTATANDLLSGKTAYDNLGNLITGNYNNNITFTLLNEIGTEQFQLSETLINLYSKIKITSDNKLSGNTYTYGITNSDGSSEITFNRNQEYNIQDLYNSGYNKIYVRSDGWAYIKVEMYN